MSGHIERFVASAQRLGLEGLPCRDTCEKRGRHLDPPHQQISNRVRLIQNLGSGPPTPPGTERHTLIIHRERRKRCGVARSAELKKGRTIFLYTTAGFMSDAHAPVARDGRDIARDIAITFLLKAEARRDPN
jgi:hypothetical protein